MTYFDTFKKLSNNMDDLGKTIIAAGFEKLPKVQKNHLIWSHWSWPQKIIIQLKYLSFVLTKIGLFFSIFFIIRIQIKYEKSTDHFVELNHLGIIGDTRLSRVGQARLFKITQKCM